MLGLFASLLLLFPTRFRSIHEQIKELEMISRDIRMHLRPERILNDKIILIGITDIEHFLYGPEINTREAYLLLLQSLERLGVQAVLFDILFEYAGSLDSALSLKFQEIPSYISYKFLSGDMPFDELEQEMGSGDLEKDGFLTSETIRTALLDSLDTMDHLVNELAQVSGEQNLNVKKEEEIERKISGLKFRKIALARLYLQQMSGLADTPDPKAAPLEKRCVILPSDLLLLSARGFGFINIAKGEEDVVRRIPLFIRYKGRLFPHLDLVFLCDYYGVSLSDLKIKFGQYVEFLPKKNYQGIKRIPIDRSGSLLVNFRERDPVNGKNSYPLHQVIHYNRFGDLYPTRIKPETFRDAIVIVGELSPGGADVEPIPLSPSYPMMAVHASVIDMVLKDDYIRDPGVAAEVFLTLAFGLLMGLIFSLCDYRRSTLISISLLFLYLLVSVYLFRSRNIFLPMIRPCAVLLLSYLFLILYTVGIKERERRKVRSIFLKTVSPHIGEEILRHYDHEAIWGAKKVVTILFADIRGFTPLSEELKAVDLVEFLDAYYDTVSQIIFDHDGVVNKFIGDAVMALFGAPLELPDAEARAVKAAINIQKAVRELNLNPILLKYQRKVYVGIGISTGEVVVGTVGRKKIRIEYTALGDNVNIAERLQGVAGPGEILINKSAYEKIMETKDPYFQEQKVQFRPLTPMILKGKEIPVEVFRVEYAAVS